MLAYCTVTSISIGGGGTPNKQTKKTFLFFLHFSTSRTLYTVCFTFNNLNNLSVFSIFLKIIFLHTNRRLKIQSEKITTKKTP